MEKELTKETVLARLSDIIDPELNVGIVDLGLIYDVRIEKVTGENSDESGAPSYKLDVDMTLTSIACPVGPSMRAAVQSRCEKISNVVDVTVNMVFDPPWNPRIHASEDAQMDLGIV